MRELNALGLKVAGITIVLMLVLFGLYWGGTKLFFNKEAELIGVKKDTVAADNTVDSDGDGVSDLREITSGSDLLVPELSDKNSELTKTEPAQKINHTQGYLAGLSGGVPSAEIFDEAKLELYISDTRGELLPVVAASTLLITPGEGKDVVVTYLDAISSTHNTSIKVVTSADIEAAFRLQRDSQEFQPMKDIMTALADNVTVLEMISVPSEVTDLHIKLVAASRSLRDNTNLLRQAERDFVGSLIGAKNIEDLGDVFQELAADIKALEEKYALE